MDAAEAFLKATGAIAVRTFLEGDSARSVVYIARRGAAATATASGDAPTLPSPEPSPPLRARLTLFQ